MKIGIIDHRGDLAYAYNNIPGLEVKCAESFDEFEKLHGSISKYDGLMLHPGRQKQRQAIDKMNQYPDIKYCILSLNHGDYHTDGKSTIISAYDIERIIEYFNIFG